MALDYASLWVLTLVNSLGVLLVIRQLAQRGRYGPGGPRIGSRLGVWNLRTLAGNVRRPTDMEAQYVMLFAADSCDPCHALLRRLANSTLGRPNVRLILAVEGDPTRLLRASEGASGRPYDEVLAGVTRDMMRRLEIPGTPYAVALRDGVVMATGPARTPEELSAIAERLTQTGPASTSG